MGYVPQEGLLFQHMSVLDNVAFASGGDRASARDLLAAFGLTSLEWAMPGQLSGGQAQLIAMARALARKPQVLLLDEPLASVDAANRAEVRRQLRRQLDRAGVVRILVTHDAVEAAALADRIVVLDNGSVIQRGTIEELVVRPRSSYVAQLVGVNFYTGVALNGVIEVEGGGVLHAPEPINGGVIASIHPRAVALHTARPSGTPRNVWQGVVESIEPSLDRVRVAVEGDLPVVAEVTRAGAATIAEGAPVWVSIKASEVTSFPQ